MKRYEYQAITCDYGEIDWSEKVRSHVARLDALGDDGWELVTSNMTTDSNREWILYFKREIDDE